MKLAGSYCRLFVHDVHACACAYTADHGEGRLRSAGVAAHGGAGHRRSAAMAGVPLLNGFLSKEMFFTEAALVSTDGEVGQKHEGFAFFDDLEDIEFLPPVHISKRGVACFAEVYTDGVWLEIFNHLAHFIHAVLRHMCGTYEIPFASIALEEGDISRI